MFPSQRQTSMLWQRWVVPGDPTYMHQPLCCVRSLLEAISLVPAPASAMELKRLACAIYAPHAHLVKPDWLPSLQSWFVSGRLQTVWPRCLRGGAWRFSCQPLAAACRVLALPGLSHPSLCLWCVCCACPMPTDNPSCSLIDLPACMLHWNEQPSLA